MVTMSSTDIISTAFLVPSIFHEHRISRSSSDAFKEKPTRRWLLDAQRSAGYKYFSRCISPKSQFCSPGPWTPERKKTFGNQDQSEGISFIPRIFFTLDPLSPRESSPKHIRVETIVRLIMYVPARLLCLDSYASSQREGRPDTERSQSSPANV